MKLKQLRKNRRANLSLDKFWFFVLIIMSLNLSAAQVIDENDIIPPTPPWWEYFTIHGVDADKDGVRDDVELWINQRYKDSNVRQAMKSLSRTLVDMIKYYDTPDEFVKAFELENVRSYCVNFVMPENINLSYQEMEKVQDKITNNIWRSYLFNKGLKNIPRGIYKIANVPFHKFLLACDFKVKEPEKIMDVFLKVNPKHEWSIDNKKEFREIYEKNTDYDVIKLFGNERRSK